MSLVRCWDDDAGTDRKTSASMQPSAPLARVWVGDGVFKVGSYLASTTTCGCHFLEEVRARSMLILPGVRAFSAGLGTKGRGGRNEGHELVAGSCWLLAGRGLTSGACLSAPKGK